MSSVGNIILRKVDLNYAQSNSGSITINTGASLPTTVTSTTITTTGSPVQIIVSGDANPLSNGAWGRLRIYRDSTPIGKTIQFESSSSNENVPYALNYIDSPIAGTYTYSAKLTNSSNHSYQFGEVDGNIITVLELAGYQGPAGPSGVQGSPGTGSQGPQGVQGAQGSQGVAGIGTTISTIQNSITITATASNPTISTRSANQVSYRTIGDKIRICYKLGWAAGTAGTGQYLLELPSGITFNTSSGYNPTYTGTLWSPSVNAMAPYTITALGGIITPNSWAQRAVVVPYSSTTFRLVLDNDDTNQPFNVWSNTWYSLSTEGLLNLEFEIWK
jgi:hypothetical protein